MREVTFTPNTYTAVVNQTGNELLSYLDGTKNAAAALPVRMYVWCPSLGHDQGLFFWTLLRSHVKMYLTTTGHRGQKQSGVRGAKLKVFGMFHVFFFLTLLATPLSCSCPSLVLILTVFKREHCILIFKKSLMIKHYCNVR